MLRTESPPLIPLLHSSPLSPSAAAATASRAFARSSPACSHHLIPTRAPGAISDPSHRSNSDRVVMYYATVFCRRLIYSSIVKNPASSLAAVAEVYLHLPSGVLRGSRPVSRLSTWAWNPSRAFPIQGMITQVSDPKSSTA